MTTVKHNITSTLKGNGIQGREWQSLRAGRYCHHQMEPDTAKKTQYGTVYGKRDPIPNYKQKERKKRGLFFSCSLIQFSALVILLNTSLTHTYQQP